MSPKQKLKKKPSLPKFMDRITPMQLKAEHDPILSAKAHSSIALEAITLVYGPRQDDYGPVASCFERTAVIMNSIKDKDDSNQYTGKQVALLMMSMKLARRQYHYKRDNNVDLIGYADLLEVFEQQNPLK